MLHIQPMHYTDIPELSGLKVDREQLPFVGKILDILGSLSDAQDSYILIKGKNIVGYFNIDRAYYPAFDFAQSGDVGFRKYFIDYRYQGNGYGSASMKLLPRYLKEQYPTHDAVVLTVNTKNKIAYHLYRKAGFIDTGDYYEGGMSGPQHIMRMPLG